MAREEQKISAAYPFDSQFVAVQQDKMHYVEQGRGDPIVFVHGIPTWSYLWRNIIPELARDGRCIALDLIGCGLSAKPKIAYTFEEHCQYFEGFIDALELQNITLVMHGWGSVIGFDYAMKYPEKIKALVFYESHIRPMLNWDMLSLPVQQIANSIELEMLDYDKVVNTDFFMEKIFPTGLLRNLSADEMQQYRRPFATPESRKLLWQYLLEIPLGKTRTHVVDTIEEYSKKLQTSTIPKLMLYSMPGFITTMDAVAWAKEHLPNLELADIDEGLHYAQESNPHEFAKAIQAWYRNL